MSSLKFIKLRISEKLRDPMYRAEFFANLAQDEIAEQILALRKKRKLRQVDVADSTGMKQSAISRLEQADYSKWNFATLLRLANALDARVRVTFQPSEDVIAHYEEVEAATALPSGATDICTAREMNAERARERGFGLISRLPSDPESNRKSYTEKSGINGGILGEREHRDAVSI